MLSSSLDTLLKVSKTTSPQKLFAYDCVTLYFADLKYRNIQGEQLNIAVLLWFLVKVTLDFFANFIVNNDVKV